MSYAKLHGSILDSSVWQTALHVKIVWITMLAMKDRDGVVEAAVPGLAHRAGVSIEQAEDALAQLSAPDRYSRTPDHDGRRIAKIDGGWEVLNHDKYRDRLDKEDQADKKAKRQARWKSKKTVVDAERRSETLGDAGRHYTDAEADPSPDRGAGVRTVFVPELPDPSKADRIERVQGGVDRAGARDAGARVPQAPHEAATSRPRASVPQAPELVTHVPDPAQVARRALVVEFIRLVNEARARVAKDLKLEGVRPVPAMGGVSESALVDRLKEGADPGGDMRHVLRVAEAEARETKELRWLGWAVAEPKAWRTKLAAVLAPKRETRGPSGSQPSSPLPEVVTMTDDDRAAMSAMARGVVRNLGGKR